MRQDKISVLRYIPYVAGLLALLTIVLLVAYFNRKLAPGAEFDQAEQPHNEELPAVVKKDETELNAVTAPKDIEETDIIEDAVVELAGAEATEEGVDTTVMEEEQVEPEADADETTAAVDNDRYRRLFNSVSLPNLQALTDPPPTITGDPATDDKIRQIAKGRGYVRQPEPADVSKLVLAEGNHYLQPEAAQAYSDLKTAMAAEGITVRLTSAYRDYNRQRQIFLGNIAPPYDDEHVFNLLKTVSIPGYSKHHTGYAVDLGEGELTFHRFVESASYRWLSANDYENARKYGWIPSYPPGVSDQGADPEPWEFVYVGVERATAI